MNSESKIESESKIDGMGKIAVDFSFKSEEAVSERVICLLSFNLKQLSGEYFYQAPHRGRPSRRPSLQLEFWPRNELELPIE